MEQRQLRSRKVNFNALAKISDQGETKEVTIKRKKVKKIQGESNLGVCQCFRVIKNIIS